MCNGYLEISFVLNKVKKEKGTKEAIYVLRVAEL